MCVVRMCVVYLIYRKDLFIYWGLGNRKAIYVFNNLSRYVWITLHAPLIYTKEYMKKV